MQRGAGGTVDIMTFLVEFPHVSPAGYHQYHGKIYARRPISYVVTSSCSATRARSAVEQSENCPCRSAAIMVAGLAKSCNGRRLRGGGLEETQSETDVGTELHSERPNRAQRMAVATSGGRDARQLGTELGTESGSERGSVARGQGVAMHNFPWIGCGRTTS
jgi:hypothetical protein